MFGLWLKGNTIEQIGPYRFLWSNDILIDEGTEDGRKATDRAKVNLSKCKYVMTKLINAYNKTEFQEAYQNAFQTYVARLYPNIAANTIDLKRVGDNSYLSIYDAMNRWHKQNQ